MDGNKWVPLNSIGFIPFTRASYWVGRIQLCKLQVLNPSSRVQFRHCQKQVHKGRHLITPPPTSLHQPHPTAKSQGPYMSLLKVFTKSPSRPVFFLVGRCLKRTFGCLFGGYLFQVGFKGIQSWTIAIVGFPDFDTHTHTRPYGSFSVGTPPGGWFPLGFLAQRAHASRTMPTSGLS